MRAPQTLERLLRTRADVIRSAAAFWRRAMMKRALFPLLAVVPALFLCSAKNAVDVSLVNLDLQIMTASRTGRITVKVGNPSKTTIKLWNESNSWGAACWRVFVIRNGQIETFYQNPYQIFTVNAPEATEVAGGAHIERSLDLNGGNWCESGYCSSYNQRGFNGGAMAFEQNDIIIAVYDVPPSTEARKMAVWHGVSAAYTTVT